jgi:Flp pilus assembly pilin Flp
MKIKNTLERLWKDESAQGATEYILLLIAVITIITMFHAEITSRVKGLLNNLGASLDSASKSE